MTQLLEDLYKSKIRYGEEDRLVWVPSQQKGFHVKLIHKEEGGGGSEPYFPRESIWKTHVSRWWLSSRSMWHLEGLDKQIINKRGA